MSSKLNLLLVLLALCMLSMRVANAAPLPQSACTDSDDPESGDCSDEGGFTAPIIKM
ncbi:hypothetical protein RI367_002191 [Sorochytrium milnesiophthora]